MGCLARCNRRIFDPIPVADELLQLSRSFGHLKGAMRSWAKYVPAILFRQLFEAGVEAQIGVTRCEVTILFCDVENFKELCEDMKPQEVLGLLEVVLHCIADVLKDYGGTLLEFIGDEVLAVFNAPAEVLKHSQCAVTAANECRERVGELAEGVRLQLGVHRAVVLAGNIGSPTRMKYGVLGDGVNLTARLKSLNTRYKTRCLVSDTALDFEGAQEMFVTRPIGHLVLKGRNSPTPTYEVLGRRGATPPKIEAAGNAQTKAFNLFLERRFAEARDLFAEAETHLSVPGTPPDGLTQHFVNLCDEYLLHPPPSSWDGSETLKKKAW